MAGRPKPAGLRLRFCRALDAETRGDVKRWASIDSVARRMGIEYEAAEELAAKLDATGLLRVGGGHSVWLREAGRQVVNSDEEARDRALIEQLIAATRLYASSTAIRELLDFTVRLRAFAPFNAMLLHIQKPGLSCCSFAANAVRLQLHALTYNFANFMRTLALPGAVAQWSLTSLREKLIKIGAKVVRHARYAVFQMAEVAVPRELFVKILRLIDGLRRRPAPA